MYGDSLAFISDTATAALEEWSTSPLIEYDYECNEPQTQPLLFNLDESSTTTPADAHRDNYLFSDEDSSEEERSLSGDVLQLPSTEASQMISATRRTTPFAVGVSRTNLVKETYPSSYSSRAIDQHQSRDIELMVANETPPKSSAYMQSYHDSVTNPVFLGKAQSYSTTNVNLADEIDPSSCTSHEYFDIEQQQGRNLELVEANEVSPKSTTALQSLSFTNSSTKPVVSSSRPEANNFDIFCGRGRGYYNRPGNVRLRELALYVLLHTRASSKKQLLEVATQLLLQATLPGRFLEFRKEQGWTPVSTAKARMKANFTLREVLRRHLQPNLAAMNAVVLGEKVKKGSREY